MPALASSPAAVPPGDVPGAFPDARPCGPGGASWAGRAGWCLWIGVAAGASTLLPPQVVVASLLLAPWVEEVLFRCGVQTALAARLGDGPAVPATAAAFAAAHVVVVLAGTGGAVPLALALVTAVPALVIGHVYRRLRSLGACVGLHAVFNAAWLALAAAAA